MDEVARWTAGDRADLFAAVAGKRRHLNPTIAEKDFWVCWALKRLFTLERPPAGLIFKGGTSLSKVYKAIARFSEDVDLSFQRADLGFAEEKDPLRANSGKQAQKAIDALAEVCRTTIRDQLLPMLDRAIAIALGTEPGEETWALSLDPDDADRQTLLFRYPVGVARDETGLAAYIRPIVRLEMGARSDHWPAEERTIVPFAAEEFGDQFKEPGCMVRVLSAERTFWEKVTILHASHHTPAERSLKQRLSRHFYDVALLYESGIGKNALEKLDLLRAVAEHQRVFFRSAWAKYEEAKPGTLRLIPRDERLRELAEDYKKMQEMIFGDPPTLEKLLATITQVEQEVNRQQHQEG